MVSNFSPIQPFCSTLPLIPQHLTIPKTPFNFAAFLPLKLMNPKLLPRITTSQKDKAPITILVDNQLTSFLEQMTIDSSPKALSTNSKQELSLRLSLVI